MTRYTDQYTKDDLYDMFANDADTARLAKQPTAIVAQQLQELAPDMEDAPEVARIIQNMAQVKER